MLRKTLFFLLAGLVSSNVSSGNQGDIDSVVSKQTESSTPGKTEKKKGVWSRTKEKLARDPKSKNSQDFKRLPSDASSQSSKHARRNSLSDHPPVVPAGRAGQDSSHMLGEDPKIRAELSKREQEQMKKEGAEAERKYKETGETPEHMGSAYLR